MGGVLTARRALRLPLVLVVVLAGLALAVAARAVTSRVAAPAMPAGLAAVDAPGPDARPVAREVGHPGGAGRAAFRLNAPADAVVTRGRDDTLVLSVRIARGASVLVVQFPGEAPDPRAGIERMRDGIGDGARTGRTRRTRVGGIDAYASDVTFASRALLREFRFAHEGQLWGIGVLVPQDDPVALDTALAMVASFRLGPA